MRPSKLTLLAIALLAAFSASVHADTDGTLCWQLSPFTDVIHVDYSVGPTGQLQLAGKWVYCALPPEGYFLPVTGAISRKSHYRLGIHGTADAGTCPDPDDSTGIALNATFTTPDLGGPWRLQCGTFKNSGTLVPISCPKACIGVPSGTSALR